MTEGSAPACPEPYRDAKHAFGDGLAMLGVTLRGIRGGVGIGSGLPRRRVAQGMLDGSVTIEFRHARGEDRRFVLRRGRTDYRP